MRRKDEDKENFVEKRRERHPVIYALSVAILVLALVARAARLAVGASPEHPPARQPGEGAAE